MSDLEKIVWNSDERSFKITKPLFKSKNKFEPGQLVDATPIGPLYAIISEDEPYRDVYQSADKHSGELVNAYEIVTAARHVTPQEYGNPQNVYAFRFYRIRPQPSRESSPELLDHIRSIPTEVRNNEDHTYD